MNHARDQLEAGWARERDLLELLGDPAFAVDAEGRVVAWNPAIEEMTGAPAAQVLGCGNREYSLRLFGERRPALVDRLLEREECPSRASEDGILEGPEVAPRGGLRAGLEGGGGERICLHGRARVLRDGEGRVTGAVESLRRPTAQPPRAEQALRRAEESFAWLFDAVPEAVAIARQRDGVLTSVNRAFQRVTGFSREEAVGRTASSLGLWDDSALRRAARRGAGEAVEVGFARKGGPPRLGLLSARPLEAQGLEEQGEPCYLAVLRNRAERAGAPPSCLQQAVLDSLPLGIVAAEAPSGELLWANRPAEAMLGAPIARGSERRALSALDLRRDGRGPYPADELPLTRALRGARCRADDLEVIRPDGTRVLLEFVGLPIFDSSGRVAAALALLSDITERRRMEGVLRASEERYRTLFEAASDAILVLRAGLILDCNARALQMFGALREEMIGRDVLDFSAPAQRNGRPSAEEKSAKLAAALQGGRQSFEWLHRRSDGSLFDAEVSLDALVPGSDLAIALVRDISERKRAEEALRKSEEKFSKVFAGAPESIVLVRSADGVLLDVNPAFEALHGIARKDAIGHTATSLGIIESFPRREQLLAELERSGEVLRVEVVVRHVGGARHIGLYSARRIEISGEACNLAFLQDITERKKMEEALREASRRKDEFLAMLSHELRNPLAPIGNAAQILRRVLPSEPRVQRAQEIIERQLAHVSRLLEDLLDAGRITRGTIALKRERLDLRELLDQAAEDAQLGLRGREADFRYVRSPVPLWMDGDRARLAQVVANLLDNAAKYTAPGQRIELSVQAQRVPEPLARVRVRDEGEGIDPELLPQVFELFAQGDRSLARTRGGLGIGLTLVRHLCEMHGGWVEAASAGPGKGSDFIATLPLAAEVPSEAPSPSGEAPRGAASPRVLVVDDNADEAQSLGDLVELWGYDVRTAVDGPAALSQAAAFEPDVVLLDIGLPRMDGYEVARRLRRAGGTAQLVAVTGYGREEDRAQSREAGFAVHLTKPVDPAELQRVLRSTAERRGSLR